MWIYYYILIDFSLTCGLSLHYLPPGTFDFVENVDDAIATAGTGQNSTDRVVGHRAAGQYGRLIAKKDRTSNHAVVSTTPAYWRDPRQNAAASPFHNSSFEHYVDSEDTSGSSGDTPRGNGTITPSKGTLAAFVLILIIVSGLVIYRFDCAGELRNPRPRVKEETSKQGKSSPVDGSSFLPGSSCADFAAVPVKEVTSSVLTYNMNGFVPSDTEVAGIDTEVAASAIPIVWTPADHREYEHSQRPLFFDLEHMNYQWQTPGNRYYMNYVNSQSNLMQQQQPQQLQRHTSQHLQRQMSQQQQQQYPQQQQLQQQQQQYPQQQQLQQQQQEIYRMQNHLNPRLPPANYYTY